MRSMLGRASRALNRMMGGEQGQTLCARVAARFGPYCWLCLFIDRFTEPGHCRRELFDWHYRK